MKILSSQSTCWVRKLPPLAGMLTLLFFAIQYGSAVLGEDKQHGDDTRLLMIIDFDDGVEKRFTRLAWRKGMTVGDLMRAAEKHRRGIRLEVRGRNDTAFVLGIDGLQNEGSRGRNWMYEINGQLGNRAYDVMPIGSRDTVLWQFRKFQ